MRTKIALKVVTCSKMYKGMKCKEMAIVHGRAGHAFGSTC